MAVDPYSQSHILKLAQELLQRAGPAAYCTTTLAQKFREAAVDPCKTFRPVSDQQDGFQRSTAAVRLVLGSNRSGKTKTGATEMMQRLTNTHPYWKPTTYRPLRGLILGMDYPTFTQQELGKKIWACTPKRHVKEVGWMDRRTEVPSYVKFDTGSEYFCVSADKDEQTFEGASWDLVWVDEIIKDSVITAVRRGLSDRRGLFWNTATPLIKTKFFRECLDYRQRDPKHYGVFNFDVRDTIKAGYVDQAYWDMYIRSVPAYQRDTRLTGAMPSTMAGGVFIRLDRCRRVNEVPGKFEPGRPVLAGLDLAKHRDYLVLTLMSEDGIVRDVIRFNQVKWTVALQQVFGILSKADSGGGVYVCVDSSGVGDCFFDMLQDLCAGYLDGMRICPIAIPTAVAALKVNLIDDLSLAIENGEIGWPAEQVPVGVDLEGKAITEIRSVEYAQRMEQELEAFSAYETSGGNIGYAAPEKGATRRLKDRLKAMDEDGLDPSQTDDCVISLALARRSLRVMESGRTYDPRTLVQFMPEPVQGDI